MLSVDSRVWQEGSQVIWLTGDIISKSSHKTLWNQSFTWIPVMEKQAVAIVREYQPFVIRLLELLLSWRSLSLSQVEMMCTSIPVPRFDRERVNVWGALVRLGVIRVGFLFSDLVLRDSGEVFVCLSALHDKNYRLLRLLGVADDMAHNYLLSKYIHSPHVAVKHNVYAAHVGWSLYRDSRVRTVGGDGVGGFRYFAPANSVNQAAAMDCVVFPRQGGVLGIEVQSDARIFDKMERWIHFLSVVPDMWCLWLIIPNASHQTMNPRVFTRYQSDSRLLTHQIGTRLLWANWSDWFTPEGLKRSHGWGIVHDFLGHTLPVLDTVKGDTWDWSPASTWLWYSVCSTISTHYHLDVTTMKPPAALLNPGIGLFQIKRV